MANVDPAKNDPFGWVGQRLANRYLVLEVAGKGGFGVVYRAEHPGLGPIAIKCLDVRASLGPASRDDFVKAFQTEAKLLYDLSDLTPHVVRVIDSGAATAPSGDWTPYFVMGWLEGETLEAEIAARAAALQPPRSLRAALDLLTPAATALQLAHKRRIAHRDIKPANIFLARQTDGEIVLKVLDFGIAKVMEETLSSTQAFMATRTDSRAFTAAYGAPEQFDKQIGATGQWTDVHAMALVFIEVVTGRRALKGEHLFALCAAACDPTVRPSLAQNGVQAPPAVEGVLRRALEVSPLTRYENMAELWQALTAAILGEPKLPPDGKSINQAPRPPPDRPVDPDAETSPAPPPPQEENPFCTILFVRLAVPPGTKDRADLLATCFRAFEERVKHWGGQSDRFFEDRMVAVFGLSAVTGNDAERALLAALDMRTAVEGLASGQRPGRRRAQIPLQIGVDTGHALVRRPSGAGTRLSVSGEPFQNAEHLHHAAIEGKIVVGRDTYRQVVGKFNMRPLPAQTVTGLHEPLLAYEVIDRTTVRQPLPPSDFYGLDTRLVGRDDIMGRIEDALHTVLMEPRPRVITLVGPPGMGRSRILVETAARLSARPEFYFLMTAQCSSVGMDSSYGLAGALIRMRFQIHDDASAGDVVRKLREGLEWLRTYDMSPRKGDKLDGSTGNFPAVGPEFWGLSSPFGDTLAGQVLDGRMAHSETSREDALEQLATLLGAREAPSASPGSLAPNEQGNVAKNRIASAAARLLQEVAARAPVVLLCDDIQWADQASLELIREIVVRLAHERVLVVCTATPELYDRKLGWGEDKSTHERIDISPLAPKYIEEMLRDRLRGASSLSPSFVKAVTERADRNPRILQETLHLLVDLEVIERRGDTCVVHPDGMGALTLPAAIRSIVHARLNRLEVDVRSIVGLASIFGRTFWAGAVEELRAMGGVDSTSRPGRKTADLVAILKDRQLVWARESSSFPSETELMFAESAVQELAYDSIPPLQRRILHRGAAAWLSARAPGNSAAARIAFHHHRGAELREAAKRYVAAASQAASLGQNAEALRHFERVRGIYAESAGEQPMSEEMKAFLDEQDDQRIASWTDRVWLSLELGDVLRRAGRLPDAVKSYEDARRGILRHERRDGETLGETAPSRWEARVEYRLALTCHIMGPGDVAQRHAERAIQLAQESGAVDETAPMWALLGAIRRRLQDPGGARAALHTGLVVCRRVKRAQRDQRWRESVSDLVGALAVLFSARGQDHLRRAERLARQAIRVIDEKKSARAASMAYNTLGSVLFDRGKHKEAKDAFLRSLKLNEREADLFQLAMAHNNLAEVELLLGDAATAYKHASWAVQLGEGAQAHGNLADIYRNMAEASLALALEEQALTYALKAFESAKALSRGEYLRPTVSTLARMCGALVLFGNDNLVRARARAAAKMLRSTLDELEPAMGAAGAERARAVLAWLDGPGETDSC